MVPDHRRRPTASLSQMSVSDVHFLRSGNNLISLSILLNARSVVLE
jgi:hypothetical protein